MKIGLFTDSYYPQISGVATSIQTLSVELEKLGHEVFIFTTTDPQADTENERNIIRLQAVPFVSLAERKVVMKGLIAAYQIAKEYDLDLIHTQTEFGMGVLGKMVAHQLKIPVIHTLHTKYEDYVHYIAKGHIIKPSMVKYVIRSFLFGTEGVICPSEMVLDTVNDYGLKLPRRVIPTGIDIAKFTRPDITNEEISNLRAELDISEDEIMLLSLSRIAEEKNIQAVIKAMPELVRQAPVRLVIVGHGPYANELKALVTSLSLEDYVSFTGPVENKQTVYYYKAADFFISASTSETQGLTYLEALAAGTSVLAAENPYLTALLSDPQFGQLFKSEAEIGETIALAIRQMKPMDPQKYQDKLFEISAENFGQQVYMFYLDTLIEYNSEKKQEANRVSFLALPDLPEFSDFTKTTVKLKKNIARTPVRIKYFQKKATKIVKNLRDYGKIDKNK